MTSIFENLFIKAYRMFRNISDIRDITLVMKPWELDAEKCHRSEIPKPETVHKIELRPKTKIQHRARSGLR